MSEYSFPFPSGTPATPASTVPEGATDHVAEALDRLPEQFRHDENVIALLTALVTPCQSLENALQQLLLERAIDTAVGTQLDVLGKLVGQKRNGQTDDIYRRFIAARISTNRSKGTVETLITIAQLILFDLDAHLAITRQRVATIEIRVDNVAVTPEIADAVITFLRVAVAAGVRIIFIYSAAAPAATFRLDTGPGLDDGWLADALT